MVQRIPWIGADGLYEFQEEIENVRSEFPFHYHTGIESWSRDDLNACPGFKAWLVREKVFTEEELALKDADDFRGPDGEIDWKAFHADPRPHQVSFAVSGT